MGVPNFAGLHKPSMPLLLTLMCAVEAADPRIAPPLDHHATWIHPHPSAFRVLASIWQRRPTLQSSHNHATIWWSICRRWASIWRRGPWFDDVDLDSGVRTLIRWCGPRFRGVDLDFVTCPWRSSPARPAAAPWCSSPPRLVAQLATWTAWATKQHVWIRSTGSTEACTLGA
jgi:hypothetical protein